ncbi:hypothetical protein AAVH_26469 [Aphelenchoides avenae]|nr:hypothetical protein AAVH_26469 [Aphelenchus avenae]
MFTGDPDKNTDVRPLDPEVLASQQLVPAQPERFQVLRHPGPNRGPFDPFHECNGHGEDTAHFHQPAALAGLVDNRDWKTKLGIKGDEKMEAILRKAKLLKPRCLAQVLLVKYARRLRGNQPDRTPAALEFVYKILTATDLRQRLPELLRQYQPILADAETLGEWPTQKDYRHATEFWSCYCAHAAAYVFEHLSGPIIFDPDWFREVTDLPELTALTNLLINDQPNVLHDLRHQFYRQYGEAYIQAIEQNLPEFSWNRFGEGPKTRKQLGNATNQPTVLFVYQAIYDAFTPNLRSGIQVIRIDITTRDDVIRQILRWFPHAMTTRVVFWFGPDYILQRNRGFCFVLASLCYHYTIHFGNVEQYVILPHYIRLMRKEWTESVLGTYIQQKEILPHARVVLHPFDVSVWDRDERQRKCLGEPRDWNSTWLEEDGHYRSGEFVAAVKENLILYHQLDLWLYDTDDDVLIVPTPSTSEASTSGLQPSTSGTSTSDHRPSTSRTSTSDHRQSSSASGSRQHTAPLPTSAPSTSAKSAHSAQGCREVGSVVAAALAARLPHKGSTPEEQALLAAASGFIAEEAYPAIKEQLQDILRPRVNDAEKRAEEQRRQKKADRSTEFRSHSRKDQDRAPRK